MRKALLGLTSVALACSAHADSSPKPLRLILLTPFVDYAFFQPVKKGAEDAARDLGVQVTFTGTQDGDVRQLSAKVQQAIAERYDGIALNIVDPVAFDRVAVEAADERVPLIAFNVDDSSSPNARLAAVGQNMLAAGRTFGHKIATAIATDSHVLLTMHDANISALEDRARGIQETLRAKNIALTTLVTSTNREQAVQRIRTALEANPSITAVIGTGSADTEAAGLAIERYFPKGRYVAAGFDLSPDILRLIKAQTISFTIDQQPYSQGYFSVVALTLYSRHGLRPANVDTGATIITSGDVDRVIDLSRRHYR